jgi:hypothetical protein
MKIKCRHCGVPNDEERDDCHACGKPLGIDLGTLKTLAEVIKEEREGREDKEKGDLGGTYNWRARK